MEAGLFTLRKTVFLDRDGVINCCAPPHCYIRRWEDFVFLPGVAEGIRLLNEAGYRVVIVTNQRGVARGLMTLSDVREINERMRTELEANGAFIDQILICPHENGTCDCRKPDIGMFLTAEKTEPVDKRYSYMIGDSDTDIEAGKRYGIKTISIGGCDFSDLSFGGLLEAAKYIAGENA
jgi:histidinol-phosphate phosphatase family protein